MPIPWLGNSLLNRTRLSGFILLSLGIHITSVIAHMAIPLERRGRRVGRLSVIAHMAIPAAKEKVKRPPPIRVKYIEPEKPLATKDGRIIDTPTPPKKKFKKPKNKDLLAKFDSRAHSNTNKKTAKTYQRKKTVVPKSRGSVDKTGTVPVRKKKVARKPQKRSAIEPRKRPLPKSDIGKYKSITRKKPKPKTSSANPKAGTGSTLALLAGFDPEPFASLNTEDLENLDDDKPVSLDTTEVKYAAYFSRIKHQIERVWIYPTEAAQRGIKGDLTLTFRISKDGNLLEVRLLDQSGYKVLDMAALKAVKEAAPFYPFPATIDREKLSIQANFVYTPQFERLSR